MREILYYGTHYMRLLAESTTDVEICGISNPLFLVDYKISYTLNLYLSTVRLVIYL